jgi:hypothetical protein
MPTAITNISREELSLQLAGVDNGADRRKFLARYKALLRSEVVKQFADLVLEKTRVDTKEALQLAEAAVLLGHKLRRKEDIALGIRAKVNALYACGLSLGHPHHLLRPQRHSLCSLPGKNPERHMRLPSHGNPRRACPPDTGRGPIRSRCPP